VTEARAGWVEMEPFLIGPENPTAFDIAMLGAVHDRVRTSAPFGPN
jgi:hypothetical protein